MVLAMAGFRSRFTSALFTALLLLTGFVPVVSAEGRCPPGQYPIGDSRAPGCAPIPSGGSADTSPRPTGRWHKTWGAFAISPGGSAGASVGKRSKSEASTAAEAACANGGGRGCKVAFSFKNQCGAAVVPTSGEGGTSFGRAATSDRANEIAMQSCSAGGGVGCKNIYAACSEPEFEAF